MRVCLQAFVFVVCYCPATLLNFAQVKSWLLSLMLSPLSTDQYAKHKLLLLMTSRSRRRQLLISDYFTGCLMAKLPGD